MWTYYVRQVHKGATSMTLEHKDQRMRLAYFMAQVRPRD